MVTLQQFSLRSIFSFFIKKIYFHFFFYAKIINTTTSFLLRPVYVAIAICNLVHNGYIYTLKKLKQKPKKKTKILNKHE